MKRVILGLGIPADEAQTYHYSSYLFLLDCTKCTYMSICLLPNLKHQIDFIKVLELIKDDRQMKNGCLYLQINFEVVVFDVRPGVFCG